MFESLENNIGLLILIYILYDFIIYSYDKINDYINEKRNIKYNLRRPRLNTNLEPLQFKQNLSYILEENNVATYYNSKYYLSNNSEEYPLIADKVVSNLENNIEELNHILLLSEQLNIPIVYVSFIDNLSQVFYFAISFEGYLSKQQNIDRLRNNLSERDFNNIKSLFNKYNIIDINREEI